MPGVAVGCLQPDQQQQTLSQAQKVLPATCQGGLRGWAKCTMFIYRKGERRGSSCGMFLKNGPYIFLQWKCHFSDSFPFHLLHLYMISMQSFLKYCAVFENELNPESFSLYFFSPGNCTNPLSISLFPRG